MRVFWALVILCGLAGGAFVFLSGGSDPLAAKAQPAPVGDAPTPKASETGRSPEPVATAEAKLPSQPEPTTVAVVPEAPEPEAASAPEPAAPGMPEVRVETPAPAAPVETSPNVPETVAPAASAELPAAAADAAAFVGPPTPPTESAADVAKIGIFEIAPGRIEKQPDGSFDLDGRFNIKGEGTADKPYEISWELLTSVEQDFDPHAGKRKLPERIAMLHDKYVKLNGWIAFPLNVQQPRELLLMLNQWDGCCIGVPPTPYDAIEASLTKIAVGDARFASTGAVTGKFGVKPYIVGDWLVGLYTMENGEFAPKTFSGGGS